MMEVGGRIGHIPKDFFLSDIEVLAYVEGGNNMDMVLNSHFNKFKQAFEISTTAGTTEEQRLKEADAFEKFVNYVLFSLDYPDVFTANMELLDFVCVGGGGDTGIDGIGIKVNDRLVRNKEEVITIACCQSAKWDTFKTEHFGMIRRY